MSDRDNHGMNCAHRSDSDEPCTCACRHHAAVDTERTMHAAWRKRAEEAERENADLRARLADTDAACANHRAARKEADWEISTLKGFIAAAEKARDEQAEAVRLLAREVRMWRSSCTYSAKEALRIAAEAREETQNNPTAAAAVREAGK